MIKYLYIYILLSFLAIYFFCYRYSFVEGYNIGNYPIKSQTNLMVNEAKFGSNSIYETGLIIKQ